MRAPTNTSEDRPAAITSEIVPPIVCNQPDDVAEVTALDEFRLRVRFNDGLEGYVDMSALIHSAHAGVFAQLADPARSCKPHPGLLLGAVRIQQQALRTTRRRSATKRMAEADRSPRPAATAERRDRPQPSRHQAQRDRINAGQQLSDGPATPTAGLQLHGEAVPTSRNVEI